MYIVMRVKQGLNRLRMNYHEDVTDNSDGVRIKSKTIVSSLFLNAKMSRGSRCTVTARESFLEVIILCGNCSGFWRKVGLRMMPDLMQDNFGQP